MGNSNMVFVLLVLVLFFCDQKLNWMVVSDMIPTHPISQASKDPDLASHLLLQALDVLRIISGTWVKDS